MLFEQDKGSVASLFLTKNFVLLVLSYGSLFYVYVIFTYLLFYLILMANSGGRIVRVSPIVVDYLDLVEGPK